MPDQIQEASAPLTVAVAGAGPRSVVYGRYALLRPDRLKVVAVAEPDPRRRNALADAHDVPPAHRFASYEDLAARPGLAEAAINTTHDRLHHPSSLALLAAGYHLLLEKPIALTDPEVRDLIDATKRHGRVTLVCHVLRYEPLYRTIKGLIDAGRIGALRSVRTVEGVSYHHLATSFIRHPRNASPGATPMIVYKSCHDLDVIAWLAVPAAAVSVASFCTPTQFRPANAPPGSTGRCLDGCAVEPACPYSARKLYADDATWDLLAWPTLDHATPPTPGQKLDALSTSSPYGRCVWRCEHGAPDRQSVLIEFESGVTASHDLLCATPAPVRTIHVLGTAGEIEGDYATGRLALRTPEPGRPGMFAEEVVETGATGGGHASSDERLVEDFVATARGEPGARGASRIEDSLVGHQIAFAADAAARGGRIVALS